MLYHSPKKKVLHKDMKITSNPEPGRYIASNPRWCYIDITNAVTTFLDLK
jgi:hypothetical protein